MRNPTNSMKIPTIARTTLSVFLSILLLSSYPSVQAANKSQKKSQNVAVPTGAKIRIAVTDLADAYTSSSSDGVTNYTPPNGFNEGLTEMMITKLIESGRFTVLERRDLKHVLGEQTLGEGGLVGSATAAKVGKLLGAKYLVGGAITQCSYSKSGSDVELHLPFGLSGGGKSKSEVALDIRIIDTTTSEIIASVEGKGEVSSSNIQLNYNKGDYGFGTRNFNNSALGQASRKAIEEAVAKILKTTDAFAALPWEGRIAEVERQNASGVSLYINAGLDAGLKVGDKLEILRPGRPITDPDTGQVIGHAKDRHIGRCLLETVEARLSTATPSEGTDFQKGDTVRLLVSGAKP